MSTGEDQALNTTGYLRVVIWFGAAAVVLLTVFVFRVGTLQPNWPVLLIVMVFAFLTCLGAMRDLIRMKPHSGNESIVQIGMAVISLVAIAAALYFAWRYGAPAVVRAVEAYVLPSFVPIAITYVVLALRVERKHKIRVYIGNRGWLFAPTPSNSTVEADARNTGARRSL
jgi:uncharacterized membrane protein